MIKYFMTFFILFIMSMTCTHAEKLIAFEDTKTKLWGFKNEKGKTIIPAQFQRVHKSEKDELLIPVSKNGIFYRMDKRGNLKFESVFYDNGWDYYEEGLARFFKNGKVGFHDKKGNVIIQPRYDFAKYFKDGRSIV
ncbi:MAG: WG repeat-containing protein, partial [Alphaproteobacteria bacterium]|nr:WG repeat-containing protein [Alphaproteobacteria bacterium]